MAAALGLAACGADHATGPGPDAGLVGTPGYTPLLAGVWTLPPTTESYRCVRMTMTSDLWISAIHPIAPNGTHHTVLMVGPPDGPDGDVECDSSLVKPSIYASGVGTDALVLPAGVAIKVAAGQQLLLNLHLFNAADAPLSGTSGIEVKTALPAEVVHEAGALLAGKDAGLVVKPGSSTQTGTCTLPAGTTVFAMAPHMHLLGTHMKVTYRAAATEVVYDKPYTFDGQRYELLAAPKTSDGTHQMIIDCSYMNPTGAIVRFGEHTEQEMCYALALVYPAPTVRGTCTR